MTLAVLALVLLGAYAALLLFYTVQWKRLGDFVPAGEEPRVPVSVIIAARNEELSLPLLLQDLAAQSYPVSLFEVLIVNDYSTDGTAALATTLPPRFRMLLPDCEPAMSSKKKAIATGVANASGELILVTDADCRIGRQWIETVAQFYRSTGAAFIAAPVKYAYQPSLLQALQVLDFMTLQGITAASVRASFGTMCNGANLAYTKAAFNDVNGFEGIDQVPTGDDMLLMYKIWKQHPDKVFYLRSKTAIVRTEPMPTWRQFLMQRRRWASKTLVYDDRRLIAVLALVLLVNVFAFVLLAAGFFHPVYFAGLALFLLVKGAVEWPFVAMVAAFFEQKKLLRYFLLLQPVHVFYTVLVGIWSQLGGYEWKGRSAQTPVTT